MRQVCWLQSSVVELRVVSGRRFVKNVDLRIQLEPPEVLFPMSVFSISTPERRRNISTRFSISRWTSCEKLYATAFPKKNSNREGPGHLVDPAWASNRQAHAPAHSRDRRSFTAVVSHLTKSSKRSAPSPSMNFRKSRALTSWDRAGRDGDIVDRVLRQPGQLRDGIDRLEIERRPQRLARRRDRHRSCRRLRTPPACTPADAHRARSRRSR